MMRDADALDMGSPNAWLMVQMQHGQVLHGTWGSMSGIGVSARARTGSTARASARARIGATARGIEGTVA